MSPDRALLLLGAALLGGGANSVVGGGSFIVFPALVGAGVAPVAANATTTLVLWPAALASLFAYRKDLDQPRPLVAAFLLASLVGGALGARLLLGTSNATFALLVPWLLLFASLLFSVSGVLTPRLRLAAGRAITTRTILIGAFTQLIISIYGGYFGGGMGIMMLAAWSALGMTNIHAMNGLRTLLGAALNGVALVAFVAAGAIAWKPGLLMVTAATAAGYAGAALARRLDPKWVRRFVIGVAWAMTAWFFARAYLPG